MFTLGYLNANGGRSWLSGVGDWSDPAITLGPDSTQFERQRFVDAWNASAIAFVRRFYPSATFVDGPRTGMFPEVSADYPVITEGTIRVSVRDHQDVLARLARGDTFGLGTDTR